MFHVTQRESELLLSRNMPRGGDEEEDGIVFAAADK